MNFSMKKTYHPQSLMTEIEYIDPAIMDRLLAYLEWYGLAYSVIEDI